MGMFYYNPNDVQVVVPKRWGFGFTFNFAHPISWLLGGGLILVPVFLGFVWG